MSVLHSSPRKRVSPKARLAMLRGLIIAKVPVRRMFGSATFRSRHWGFLPKAAP